MEPKETLQKLIDAYAAARMTQNDLLVNMSISALQSFLSENDIIPKQKSAAEE